MYSNSSRTSFLCCLSVLLLLFFLPATLSAKKDGELEKGAREKRVFVIFSYPTGQWNNGIQEGLTNGLIERDIKHDIGSYVYHYEFFKGKSRGAVDKEIDVILGKLRVYKPDFIVVSDDEAAEKVVPRLYALNIPVIFTGINKAVKDLSWLQKGNKITGILERYPIEKSLKLLSDLTRGKTKKISILTSKNDSSLIILEQFKKYFAENKPDIKLDRVYALSDWAEWKKSVLEMNKKTDALWMLVPWSVKDEDGDEVDLRIMGKWLAEHIKIPSISIVDISLHLGVMASISVTPQILGEEVAEIIDILINEKISIEKVPIKTPDKCEIIINKKQADALGIKIPIGILEYSKILKKADLKTNR